MAFSIATNPYEALMNISKGDLRQIIWGGLIFDPGTHNPDDPTPVGNIMRMNLVVDDSGQKIANRMAVFFNSGQNIPGGRYGAIVLDIDCAYPNEIADTVHNWEGWQQCDFLISDYFGPQDAGKECFVIFDDDSYTSGQFYYYAEEGGWDRHVTFGEDAELDAILDNSETTENFNRAMENMEWPVQETGVIHTVKGPDGEPYDTCYYGTTDVPRISFNNYPEGVDSPGDTIITWGIRGLRRLESIELENGETAVADYHGEDGDSFLVECAIYRSPEFNNDYPIDPSLFRAWRQRNVYDGDYDANSRIVIEVYPNVAYIQNSQCWMAIRRVYRCMEVDGNFVYTLYTDENNRENMPFIYGKNLWWHWTDPDSAITPAWDLEEGEPNYNPDGHMMTSYGEFVESLYGDWWNFKIGDYIGSIDIMDETGGPLFDEEFYPAGSNEMRLYKINEFSIDGVNYEDLDPEVQARLYEQAQISYPVIAVDITGKMQIDTGNTIYHWETSPDGFLQGLMIASLPAELLEQWQDNESFQQWVDTWAEEHDGVNPTYDDVMGLINPLEYLCNYRDSFGGGGGWKEYWHYDEEEEQQ